MCLMSPRDSRDVRLRGGKGVIGPAENRPHVEFSASATPCDTGGPSFPACAASFGLPSSDDRLLSLFYHACVHSSRCGPAAPNSTVNLPPAGFLCGAPAAPIADWYSCFTVPLRPVSPAPCARQIRANLRASAQERAGAGGEPRLGLSRWPGPIRQRSHRAGSTAGLVRR